MADFTSRARVEDIVACVNVESPTDMELLKSQLGRELPSWQQPRIWWCATSLRPDARGKLSRAQWRERYLAENRLPHLVSAT